MTSLALTSGTRSSGRLGLVAEAFASRVVELGRAIANRRAAMRLARFDDRMLADIGLNRSDVHDAISAPVWLDPTLVLAERVRERRTNRRRVVHFEASLVTAPPLAPRDSDGHWEMAVEETSPQAR